MLKRNLQPLSTEGQWQTVDEFSLLGEAGCEYQAAEMFSEILVSIHIPDRVLVEAKQAVVKVLEKEMSNIVVDQAQRTFTILVQTQLSQSLEEPVNEADSRESHSDSRGWGFFLTEKRTSESKSDSAMNYVFINVHLYHEGRLA